MREKPKESDWKAYSNLVPVVRDRYLAKVNASLAQLLQSEDQAPTENFWEVEDKIRKEAKILRDCLGNHSRSNLWLSARQMLHYGMLTEADLEKFSAELRDELLAGRNL